MFLQHVKVHQDNGTPTALDRDAWMNVQVDTLAKSRIREQQSKIQNMIKIPGKQWSCYIEGRKVVKNMEKQIQDHINSRPIMQYWRTKGRIIEKYTPVDWEAHPNRNGGWDNLLWVSLHTDKTWTDGNYKWQQNAHGARQATKTKATSSDACIQQWECNGRNY